MTEATRLSIAGLSPVQHATHIGEAGFLTPTATTTGLTPGGYMAHGQALPEVGLV